MGIALAAAGLALFSGKSLREEKTVDAAIVTLPGQVPGETADHRKIAGVIRSGDTFFDIFKKHGLDITELFRIREASAHAFDLGRLTSGQPYRITFDGESRILSMEYQIDDGSMLQVRKEAEGFLADRVPVPYESRLRLVDGRVKSNLVSAVDDPLLALKLSDIFAWDIDFTTDLREGDSVRLVVEELWLDGEFKKYGDVLAAQFFNDGQVYHAYRFDRGGRADYYDGRGNSLKRAFLKAPLSYRRISSGFSSKRVHPVLKTRRPHLGVDYAAPAGTPVSAVGDGTVVFAGWKGQNGNLVILRHPGGYRTYYGHLSRIVRGLRSGSKVAQGQVIGAVGRSGLATGPHLDYRIKKDGRFLNPLSLDLPRGTPVEQTAMGEFRDFRQEMDVLLSRGPSIAASSAGQETPGPMPGTAVEPASVAAREKSSARHSRPTLSATSGDRGISLRGN